MTPERPGWRLCNLLLVGVAMAICFHFTVPVTTAQTDDYDKTLAIRNVPTDTFCILAVSACSLATIASEKKGNASAAADLFAADNIAVIVSPQRNHAPLTNVLVVKLFSEPVNKQSVFENAGKDFFFRNFDYKKAAYRDQELYYPYFFESGEPVEAGFNSPTILFDGENTVLMGATPVIHRVVEDRAKTSFGKSLADKIDRTSEIQLLFTDGKKLLSLTPFQNLLEFLNVSVADAGQLKDIERFELRLDFDEMG